MTVSNYALIDDGKVVNVIVADAVFISAQPENYVACPDDVGIGWGHVDGKFTPPPKPEPQ